LLLSFIRPIDAGHGNEYDLADAGGSGGFENLEGAAHVEVEEIKGVFVAAIFMDAVPGGYVNDEVAAAKYLRELRPVQNRRLDKHHSLFQIPRRAIIQNDRRVALAEQHGHEGLAEISRPSGQKHLHITFSRVTRIE